MIVKGIHCGVLKISSQVGSRPFAATVADGWTREGRSSQLGLHVGCALAPTIPSIIETNTRTTVEMRIVIRGESRTNNNDLARRAFIMAENYTADESPHLTGQVIHIFRGYAWSKVHNLGEARHEEECTWIINMVGPMASNLRDNLRPDSTIVIRTKLRTNFSCSQPQPADKAWYTTHGPPGITPAQRVPSTQVQVERADPGLTKASVWTTTVGIRCFPGTSECWEFADLFIRDVQDVQGRRTRLGRSDNLTFRDFRFLPRLLPNHRFLNERPLLVFAQLVSIPQSEQTIANHLSGLLGPVLADAARLLPSGGRGRKKADHVNVIVGHFVQARTGLMALPCLAIDEALSDVVLPSGCDRRLVPLLSAHFARVYGDQVTEVLRRPPPGCYACDNLDCSRVPWSALSIESLTRRLCTLSVDVLSQCICRLPFDGRPVLNTRSRTKSSNGLACHSASETIENRETPSIQVFPIAVDTSTIKPTLQSYYNRIQGYLITAYMDLAFLLYRASGAIYPRDAHREESGRTNNNDLARHPCIMAENYTTDESPHFTGQVIHIGRSYAWSKVYNLGEARHEEESLEADAGVAMINIPDRFR
ncbi:uncharacterized protein F5891DRAFT_973701 [Suillus fuscotomentosus]|uniref:Uncharacterized protein n=1 Tax=Suillus fuscotomentosus TaxID=1912939 RepID=A0AAD4ELD8_9AGAM|nr:uncharacterized protein F5891DRAFT_973701 [Suillus fuscotomentosus]KAG1908240.1 hypothetical protein F5891DRAFT_973701 [Suillus fuscotomentosus]